MYLFVCSFVYLLIYLFWHLQGELDHYRPEQLQVWYCLPTKCIIRLNLITIIIIIITIIMISLFHAAPCKYSTRNLTPVPSRLGASKRVFPCMESVVEPRYDIFIFNVTEKKTLLSTLRRFLNILQHRLHSPMRTYNSQQPEAGS